MKNIHLLYTDKPSRLVKYKNNLSIENKSIYGEPSIQLEALNIYITSDEKTAPSKGDWYLGHPLYTSIHRWHTDVSKIDGRDVWINKIILTTDQDLIKDSVQAIDDEFLEWFVNNPSCEQIEVQKWFDGVDFLEYKIIIPKEEPMSYEEFRVNASECLLEQFDADCLKYSEDGNSDNHFYADCKYWENQLKEELKQERSYSEEEVDKLITIIQWYDDNSDVRPDSETFIWFEQFKKK